MHGLTTQAVACLLLATAVLAWPPPEDHRGPEPGGRGRSGWLATVGRTLRRRGRPDEAWVAEFAEVVAVGLRAGLDLGGAAVAGARSPGVRSAVPWLEGRIVGSLASGAGVAECIDRTRHAEAAHRLSPTVAADLARLATAWRLAEQLGASAARVTSTAAGSLRARRAAAEAAEVALAGPRTSMWLLTALPTAGPVVGLALGVPPDELYGSAPARLAACVGVLLTVAGWAWSRALLTRAARPARTDGSIG